MEAWQNQAILDSTYIYIANSFWHINTAPAANRISHVLTYFCVQVMV